MSPQELINRIRQQGFDLIVEQNEILVEGGAGDLSPELENEIFKSKSALVEFLNQETAQVDSSLSRSQSNNSSTSVPLSFAQQRLWFLDQLDGGHSSTYNVPWAVRLKGALDVVALERSISEIILRHESLRTHFAPILDGVVQIVSTPSESQLTVVDLLQEAEAESTLANKLREEAQRPFDLSTGPLIRSTLFSISPNDHVLLVVFHHIVTDGWSTTIFEKELSRLYEAFLSGESSPLEPLTFQYADYARWQHDSLQGDKLENELSHWKSCLKGAPHVLDIPTDKPRPAVQTYIGATHRFEFGEDLTHQLKEYSLEAGATLFMTLLSGFYVLLHRYTDQEDILIGTPVSNRSPVDTEELIGFFVNTVVVRSVLSGTHSFQEVLKGVRDSMFNALEHQDLPFDKLVAELGVLPDRSRNPLFQVLFTLQSERKGKLDFSGLQVETQKVEFSTAKIDLALVVTSGDNKLSGSFNYNTDIFQVDTISQMANHLQNVLKSALENPDNPLAELQVLSPDERQRLLVEWNENATEYPRSLSIQEVFEAEVARAPNAIALEFQGEKLTYLELNERADMLANRLIHLGVEPEQLVGLFVERSLDVIIGMLGILKSGGAFVPIDPSYPRDRIKYMLEDSGVGIVLSMQHLLSQIPEGVWQTVTIANYSDVGGPRRIEDRKGKASADSLAYMIYTSGSTGKPKGALIEHRGVIRLVKNSTLASIGPEDVMLQSAPLSFDACLSQIWGALLNGARLIILPPERYTIAEFSTAIKEHKVTVFSVPPALLQMLVEERLNDLSSVRHVWSAGDIASSSHVSKLLQTYPDISYSNAYGPTECSVGVCAHRIRSGEPVPTQMPIGRPLSNNLIYILDGHMQPVPIGVAGELYVGGDGVGRGYHNRPELTAERFVSNPFGDEEGDRLYRTGDKVRWLRDGTIEFMGRFDTQVKLRGYRIELGEIDATLERHPSVIQSVTVMREDRPDERRLVSYVVLRDAGPDQSQELKRFASEYVPNYMVPSVIVRLDAMPLTPSLKVDRKNLPAPADFGAETGTEYIEPQTELERRLAEIWSELLSVENVGLQDDFFDLGGHSMLAMQVVSRIRTQIDVNIPVSVVFEAPVLSDFSEIVYTVVEQGLGGPTRNGSQMRLREIRRVDHEGPIGVSFAQHRLYFLDQLEGGRSSTYNVPYAVRLTGRLDVTALERSLMEIIRRHESLRTHFASVKGDVVQVISKPSERALRLVEIESGAEAEAKLQNEIGAEARRPFDLTEGPLLRCTLYALAPDEHVLQLVMHHAVTDGWSFGILEHELSTLYEAFVQGSPSPLQDLTIQYTDYAQWQRDDLQGDKLREELSYWRSYLNGASHVLDFPTDRARPVVQTYSGSRQAIEIDAQLTTRLKEYSVDEGATLFMTLLTAFSVLLYRYTNQEDILIGTPISNRTRVEIEPLIGYFVNTLVIRANFGGNPTFKDALEAVKESVISASDHQDLPFEKLVAELGVEPDRSRNPLFQVLFTLNTVSSPGPALSGIQARRVRTDFDDSKTDLFLAVSDKDGVLNCSFNYNSDLFEASTIKQLSRHFQAVLEEVISQDHVGISNISILTASDLNNLLVEWNATAPEKPSDKSISELFEIVVRDAPDSIALRYEGGSLTYNELNRRANILAHRLTEQGVSQETPVGLYARRSVDAIVAILAIVKAGGAYVPLDPDYPSARLQFMIRDSGIQLVLVEPGLDWTLHDWGGSTLSMVNPDEASSSDEEENLAPRCTATNLAYLMYTSGSTGRPKGVLIEQKAITRLVTSPNYVSVSDADVFLQFASMSFDASTFEIWCPLLNGATLAIAPPGHLSLSELGKCIRDNDVSILWLTASLFTEMIKHQLEDLRNLTFLLAGGDILSTASVLAAVHGLPNTTIVNGYGPTENTTFSTCYRVSADFADHLRVPIGVPVSNSSAYILDEFMQPVPIGVAGELYVGGDGVGRGYHNRPELTAERFVSNPFSDEEGDRLYRTGDKVRWLRDGTIEFMGRFDTQVKLRGYRIELGEIDATLERHPSVIQSVTVMREDRPDERRLVSYVVLREAGPDQSHELKRYASEYVPNYMVPSVIVRLDAMPLTPSLKVDRKNLPAPADFGAETGTEYIEPQTELERRLAEIWSELLSVENVGLQDDFFDLGGHSILALKLMNRIEVLTGKVLPLATLFRAPKLGELASHITNGEADSETQSNVVAINESGVKDPLFLVPGLGGNVVGFSELARHLGPEQPVYGLSAPGVDGKSSPLNSVKKLAAHLVREMENVKTPGPIHIVGYSFGGLVAHEMAVQLSQNGAKVGLLCILDGHPPTDLTHLGSLERSIRIARYHSLKRLKKFILLPRNFRKWIKNCRPSSIRTDAPNSDRHYYDLVPYEAGEGQMSERLRAVLDAHNQAQRDHTPSFYNGTLLFIRSVRKWELVSRWRLFGLYRWKDFVREVREVTMSGRHLELLSDRNAAVLADILESHLSDFGNGQAS